MLTLAPMSLCRADEFLHTCHPEIADAVEEYELRGGTHFYYLQDGTTAKVNKHKASLVDGDGNTLRVLTRFTS